MKQKNAAGHNIQSRLTASLLGVVGSFVLFAAYLVVPPIGIFSGVLAPFPVAYNRLVHGRTASVIVLLGSTTAVTGLFGIFAGSLYLGMCAMTGFFMPELLTRHVTASRALFWTTAANLLIFVAGVVCYGVVSGTNLQQVLSAEVTESLKQAVILYEKGGVSGEELDVVKRSMTTAAELLQRLYPACITALFVAIAGCNLLLIRKSTVTLCPHLLIGEFKTFRSPDLLVWPLILTGFALLLPDSLLTVPALNLLLVICLVYFFQGMAVVSAMTAKNSVPSLLRVILYALLIIQPYLVALITGIGLFDLWVDFRTPKTQENL